jgi:putative ABC transport system substrate-binding protein
MQSAKAELIINMKTAKALGPTIPLPLLGCADEVIELRRRQFIAGVGAVVAMPIAARAQQPHGMRRVGILMGTAENDRETQSKLDAFRRSLRELGWTDGRNIGFEYRMAAANADLRRSYALELVSHNPDVLLAHSVPVAIALKQATASIPIVCAWGGDLVAVGLVASLARPGGNVTGFMATEPSLGGKWLELLKEAAPNVKRVAIVRAPENPGKSLYLRSINAANSKLDFELTNLDAQDAVQIERAVDAFAHAANSGLLILPGASTSVYRSAIVAAAARNQLPSIYPFRNFAVDGGLLAYGADEIDLFRRAASYVHRVLHGEKPADLPVQVPTKFELVINLKTAKDLGLVVPAVLLTRADEVIE